MRPRRPSRRTQLALVFILPSVLLLAVAWFTFAGVALCAAGVMVVARSLLAAAGEHVPALDELAL